MIDVVHECSICVFYRFPYNRRGIEEAVDVVLSILNLHVLTIVTAIASFQHARDCNPHNYRAPAIGLV